MNKKIEIFGIILIIFLAFSEILEAQNVQTKKVIFTDMNRTFTFENTEIPVFAYAIPDYEPDAFDLIYNKVDDNSYSVTLRENPFWKSSDEEKDTFKCEYYKVNSDGTIECVEFEDIKGSDIRKLVFDRELQEEKIFTNEYIKITYSKIEPDMFYFSYTSLMDGYKLKLVKKGNPTSISLNKLCKREYFDDLKFINFSVDYNLRYEQIIITPGVLGSPWEIRIGTVQDRGCSSPNLNKLKKFQNQSEYLRLLPK